MQNIVLSVKCKCYHFLVKRFLVTIECPQTCPRGTAETKVCGTDGETYATRCQLESESCQAQNEDLAIAYKGECKEGMFFM